MKNELDQRLVLKVFEKVRQHGEKTPQGHQLEGMHAYTDFDGYTAFLAYQEVVLTLGFHNQYQFDYPNRHQLELFMNKIKQLNSRY